MPRHPWPQPVAPPKRDGTHQACGFCLEPAGAQPLGRLHGLAAVAPPAKPFLPAALPAFASIESGRLIEPGSDTNPEQRLIAHRTGIYWRHWEDGNAMRPGVSPNRRNRRLSHGHRVRTAENPPPDPRRKGFGRNSSSAGEMTPGEARMAREVRMAHDERPRSRLACWLRAWSLIGHWALVIRHFATGAGRPASCTQRI